MSADIVTIVVGEEEFVIPRATILARPDTTLARCLGDCPHEVR
jgi:hypothetical protein